MSTGDREQLLEYSSGLEESDTTDLLLDMLAQGRPFVFLVATSAERDEEDSDYLKVGVSISAGNIDSMNQVVEFLEHAAWSIREGERQNG